MVYVTEVGSKYMGNTSVIDRYRGSKTASRVVCYSLNAYKKTNATKIANFLASAKARIVGFVDGLLFGNENIVAVPA